MVLHDLTLASRFCDRVLLLEHGRTVACGTTRKVLTAANLQRVYQVQAMLGEHEQQRYVLPWRCRPEPTPTPTLTPPPGQPTPAPHLTHFATSA